MTDQQKTMIAAMRHNGASYTVIARRLEIPVNTLKSYMHRIRNEIPASNMHRCKQCAARVKQNHKRKEKLFCSDKCRLAWWRANRTLCKTIESRPCPCCGEVFSARPSQTYCQHACYIKTRFGRGHHSHAAI